MNSTGIASLRRGASSRCRALIALAAALPYFAASAAAEQTVVYQSGADGYHTYRIPAIVRAANGDLLAFAEGRKTGGGDAGDIDIVMKRSSDEGDNWSEMQVVEDEWDDPTAEITWGNPVPIVDTSHPEHPGRIWLAYTRNNERVFVTSSDDNGVTWAERREVTESATKPEWNWYATGPGHGIQLERGPHGGRLIVPADHAIEGKKQWGAHVLLSDDHGATWRLGAVDTHGEDAAVNPNENMAVELTDGRVYFNARDQHGADPAARAVAVSSDGGESYDKPFSPAPEFVTPVVQNSVLRVAAADRGDDDNLIAWCGPGQRDDRANLTVMVSRDEGRTWSAPKRLETGFAAYSDMVLLEGPQLGVLWEAGPGRYERIVFNTYGRGELSN